MMRFLILGLVSLVLAPAILTGYYVNEIRIARSETAARVDEAFLKFGKEPSLTGLPPQRKAMLLKIEDPAFYQHQGVDLSTPGAGMTTITQGLVKQLYFPDGFQQGVSKIRQTLIARYALEDIVSKDEQLQLFLCIAYLGEVNGEAIHGFHRAAEVYFGKPFAALSDDEFMALVSMLMAPNKMKPDSAAGKERLRLVTAFLAGQIKPQSVLDVEYVGKTGGSLAEEALMGFLRLVTNAG
jgi:membrane carboxypeptidase/penicillin-binding protein PbpC